jgi:hypothetical protein
MQRLMGVDQVGMKAFECLVRCGLVAHKRVHFQEAGKSPTVSNRPSNPPALASGTAVAEPRDVAEIDAANYRRDDVRHQE